MDVSTALACAEYVESVPMDWIIDTGSGNHLAGQGELPQSLQFSRPYGQAVSAAHGCTEPADEMVVSVAAETRHLTALCAPGAHSTRCQPPPYLWLDGHHGLVAHLDEPFDAAREDDAPAPLTRYFEPFVSAQMKELDKLREPGVWNEATVPLPLMTVRVSHRAIYALSWRWDSDHADYDGKPSARLL